MKEILSHYRCSCGKLLLKGFILVGEAEIKCRYCKATSLIRGLNGGPSCKNRYLLVADNLGTIDRASSSASIVLGYPSAEFKGMPVGNILGGIDEKTARDLWTRLENNTYNKIVFKCRELAKNGKKQMVYVAARRYSLSPGVENLVFDVEHRKPQAVKTLSAALLNS